MRKDDSPNASGRKFDGCGDCDRRFDYVDRPGSGGRHGTKSSRESSSCLSSDCEGESHSGVVKLEVVVRGNGSVKSAKVLGGSPLLIDSATEAVSKWKFEPAPQETTEVVQVQFGD